MAGRAVTVLAQPGDNWMIHVAVEQCRKGDILVVGCTTDNTDGMFGELLATSLMARGVRRARDRCRLPRRQSADQIGISGVVAGDFGEGDGEGHAGRSQRARRRAPARW